MPRLLPFIIFLSLLLPSVALADDQKSFDRDLATFLADAARYRAEGERLDAAKIAHSQEFARYEAYGKGVVAQIEAWVAEVKACREPQYGYPRCKALREQRERQSDQLIAELKGRQASLQAAAERHNAALQVHTQVYEALKVREAELNRRKAALAAASATGGACKPDAPAQWYWVPNYCPIFQFDPKHGPGQSKAQCNSYFSKPHDGSPAVNKSCVLSCGTAAPACAAPPNP